MGSIVLERAAGQDPESARQTDGKRGASTTPDNSMGDLSVAADDSNRKETQRTVKEFSRDLSTSLHKKTGDWGLYLFCRVLLNQSFVNSSFERRHRLGKAVDDPSKLRLDPFVAKRTPAGDLMMVLSNNEQEKFKGNYDVIAVISPDKSKKKLGRMDGNTVIFSDPKKEIASDWLIVRQPQSFIGKRCGGDQIAWVEEKLFKTNVVESLLRRNKCCSVGAALEAGARKEAAAASTAS